MKSLLLSAATGFWLVVAACAFSPSGETEAALEGSMQSSVMQEPLAAVLMVYPNLENMYDDDPLAYMILIMSNGQMPLIFTGYEYRHSAGLQAMVKDIRYNSDIPVQDIRLNVQHEELL